MKIAVITGASSGIGREFALALDKEESFDEIWLIARREERLNALSGLLRSRARVLPADLTRREEIDAYGELLAAEKPEIAVLVNAAGCGRFRAFTEDPLETHRDIIALNDTALVSMTFLSLPYMKKGSRIYEMGSLSCFQPVPYMNVYAASKAFVLSFSRGLRAELKGRGIRVMAVCPGWIRTEFFDRAKTDDTVSRFNRFYGPGEVAAKALKDMKKGKAVSILGLPERIQVLSVKLLPHSFVIRTWLRQQKRH